MSPATVFTVTVAVAAAWLVVRWLGARRIQRPLPAPPPLGRRSNWHEGRVILIYGRLGAGKTAYAVHRAVRLARSQRLPLIANAPVRPDVHLLRSWDDISSLPLCTDRRGFDNGYGEVVRGGCVNDQPDQPCPGCHPAVLLLDEIHMWLPSQPGLMDRDVVRDAIELLSYARKRGWTIIATTQYPTRVSTQFRYLATEMLEVSAFSPGFLHTVRSVDPDTHRQILGFAGAFSPRRARYNTRAEVTPLWQAEGEAKPAPAATRNAAPRGFVPAPGREVPAP